MNISLTQKFSPTQDAFMDKVSPTNLNNGTTLVVAAKSALGSVPTQRSVLTFNLNKVPRGKRKVITARLLFYVTTNANPKPWTIRRIRRANWVEAEMSWNNYKAATAWRTAGASDSTQDHDTTNEFSYALTAGTGLKEIPTEADFIALVQDAFDSRDGLLHLQLKVTDENPASDVNCIFSSKDQTTNSQPTLVIELTDGGGYMAAAHSGLVKPPSGW